MFFVSALTFTSVTSHRYMLEGSSAWGHGYFFYTAVNQKRVLVYKWLYYHCLQMGEPSSPNDGMSTLERRSHSTGTAPDQKGMSTYMLASFFKVFFLLLSGCT